MSWLNLDLGVRHVGANYELPLSLSYAAYVFLFFFLLMQIKVPQQMYKGSSILQNLLSTK